jgi:hypothetical protein
MAHCPNCQSSNIVVTEEVYTRKSRLYYRFLQTISIIIIMIISVILNEIIVGFLLSFGVALAIYVLALINASKKSSSRTKISCLDCKKKAYL